MVVGAHGHFHAVHIIRHAVVEYVGEDVEVVPPYRFRYHPLALAGGKTGAAGAHQCADPVAAVLLDVPIPEESVDFKRQPFTAAHPHKAQPAKLRSLAAHKRHSLIID
jgi:hypothetical protein